MATSYFYLIIILKIVKNIRFCDIGKISRSEPAILCLGTGELLDFDNTNRSEMVCFTLPQILVQIGALRMPPSDRVIRQLFCGGGL